MSALITGASGFLGRHLVRALLDAGREVVAHTRDPAALTDLRHPALQTTSGDLRDPSSCSPGLVPGGTVFHLAAVRNDLRVPRIRAREMEEVNVRVTAELARRAMDAGVGRFVHLATALIHGPSDGEGSPFGAYMESKVRGVQEVRRLVAEGLRAVIVSPAIVYGSDHPSHPNRITSEIRRLLRRRVVRVLGGGRQARNLVHVDDVVRGLLAAEHRGVVGEEYVLGGEEITPREFGRLVLSLAGLRPLATLSLPAGPALVLARAADRLRKVEAGNGYTTAVQVLLREWRFSSDRAMRDLEYCPVPLAEGLARTINWVRGSGDA